MFTAAFRRHFTNSNNRLDGTIYKNHETLLQKASAFALLSQALFLFSFYDLSSVHPENNGSTLEKIDQHKLIIGSTILSLSVPTAIYFAFKKRVKRITLLKNGTVVQVTNLLPFRNQEFYAKSDLFTKMRVQDATNVTLHFGNQHSYIIDTTQEFKPDQDSFNKAFLKF